VRIGTRFARLIREGLGRVNATAGIGPSPLNAPVTKAHKAVRSARLGCGPAYLVYIARMSLTPPSAERPRSLIRRLLPLIVVILLAGVGYLILGQGGISLEALVKHRMEIDDFVNAHRVLAVLAYIALYAAAVALSLPGAVFLTVSGGFLFGLAIGASAAVIGATIGATLIFLVARTALGEPLLRRNIEQLVGMLAGLHTPAGKPLEITLTTNGVLLARLAQPLRDAGLARISVSLDSLTDATFRRMSDTDVPVGTVLDGIDAAQRAGFAPVKVNMVVRRGVNDHEIIAMAEHFRAKNIQGQVTVLRFIEYMDVGSTNGWRMDEVVTAGEILERIASHYPIQAMAPDHFGEVAERWHYADGGGEIGVIASITRAFCKDCTRARLSTDGKLYTCLFATQGADLRAPLRAGATDDILTELIASRWQQRADRYSQLRQAATQDLTMESPGPKKIEMSYIGG